MLFKTLRKAAIGKICFKWIKISTASFLIMVPINLEITSLLNVRTW